VCTEAGGSERGDAAGSMSCAAAGVGGVRGGGLSDGGRGRGGGGGEGGGGGGELLGDEGEGEKRGTQGDMLNMSKDIYMYTYIRTYI